MAKPKVIRIGRWEWTSEEFAVMSAAAKKRGEDQLKREPLAVGVRYLRRSEQVVLELNNGSTFSIPAKSLQGVADAEHVARADIKILGPGTGLEWTTLDMHFSVAGLLAGRFGTKKWMERLQRRRKSAASGVMPHPLAKQKPASQNSRKLIASRTA